MSKPRGGPTPAQQAQLCRLLRAGAPLGLACTALGVTERTVRRWLSLGRSTMPTSRFTALRAAVEAARAAFHDDVERMMRARLRAPDEGEPDAYH